MEDEKKTRLGFAMCGSFCTFRTAIDELRALSAAGYDIYPIMSAAASSTDTRFGAAEDFRREVAEICGREPMLTIKDAEPIGPKALLDVLLVEPCTGNTLGKLACGITDTPVTMAVKAHLRGGRPVVLAVSTNDALAASARSIAALMNTKNIYFVPMRQDSPQNKPTSLVADFGASRETIENALSGKQLQPVYL